MVIGNGIGISWGKVSMAKGAVVNEAFEFIVKTDNAGTSAADQFTIPTTGTGYNYDISTSDGQSISGATGNTTITFPSAGSYTIKITGDFPRIYFDGTGDRLKITNISNWGVGVWDSFYRAFYNCNNMTITATDVPNVSAVTSFYFGFRGTAISGPIDLSSWDLSSVAQIGYMFANCTGITSVNLSSLSTNAIASDGAFLGANSTTTITLPVGFRPTVFRNMFSNANSLTDIVNVETWNLSSAVRGDYWLQNTTVQPNISGWTIPPTFTILKGIFAYCQFNVDVSGWDVSNVQDFSELCAVNPAFNQDISGWNMASATNLDAAFTSATSFNQPIGSWNVSNVTSMNQVFQSANAFDQDLSGWNTSNVTTMRQMFLAYMANQGNTTLDSIGFWDVSNVTDMYRMFESVNWGNPNISSWNTQNVQNFGRFMQSSGYFNRDLSGWNTSSSTNMSNMFAYGNSQPGNISSWDIDQVTNFTNFMIANNSALSTADYDAVLVSWENQLQVAYPGGTGYTPVISIHFGASQYTLGSAAEAARTSLINTYGWTITDGGGIVAPFRFTVDTTQAGTSASDQFTIPITSSTPYNISTSDGQSITGATGSTTLTFPSPGTYTVEISDSCEGWRFGNGGDRLKLMNISSWGPFRSTTAGAFQGASNMTATATDTPAGTHPNMNACFAGCTNFNGVIGDWVTPGNDFRNVFTGASSFNQPLNNWDVSNATTVVSMFQGASSFNQDLDNWDLSNVGTNNFASMFNGASSFNGNLGQWTPKGSVIRMFESANSFTNNSISTWDMSGVTGMAYMFRNASGFNSDISSWDTSNVTDMIEMFQGCSIFNQPIGSWDVSNVTRFSYTFHQCSAFNQPLGNWDVSKCTTFNQMFRFASSFNQDIGNWDMSSAVSGNAFKEMFRSASAYNNGGQQINWITSPGVADMSLMFYQCTNFKQSFHSINITSLVNNGNFEDGVTLPTESYNATLIAWNSQLEAAYPGGVGYTINLGWTFNGSTYTAGSAAEAARTNLINTFGWTIVDGGAVAEAFEFTVNTTIGATGHSAGDQFQLPLSATGSINATVNWGDGNSDTITAYTDAAALHTYAAPGIYNISVDGQISNFNFNGSSGVQTFTDRRKITSIGKWGQLEIVDGNNMFYWCINLVTLPFDAPKISTSSLQFTFFDCWNFNGHLDSWDMSGVTNMQGMLDGTFNFNQPISSWKTNSVTNMDRLFRNTYLFNKPLNSWNVDNVTNMQLMFQGARAFNQPLDNWNVSNVSANQSMFNGALAFNQDISGWDASGWAFPQGIFNGATAFNQPVGLWDPTSWSGYRLMFNNCPAFDQDLSSYPPTKSNNGQFLGGTSALSPLNYGKLLDVWSQGTVASGLTWDMGGSTYYFDGRGEAGKNSLVSTYGLTFLDGGAIYALDNVPAPSVAYSLRQLKTGVTNVVRVRRDSDNAEQDFTAAQVIDGTLTTFVGAGNGYVHTLYDQSGNGNNAVNTDTAKQPLVVISGVLVTENGKPMVDYQSTVGNVLNITTPISYATNTAYSFFGNGTKLSNGNSSFLGGASGSLQFRYSSGVIALRQGVAQILTFPTPASTGHFTVSYRVNATNQEVTVNDTYNNGAGGGVVSGAGGFTNTIQCVGASTSGGSEDFEGKMGDFILYDTDQWSNQAIIQDAINDYYDIY